MTNTDKAQAAAELITTLTRELHDSGAGHGVALLALLSMVHAIAKAHPCCTRSAAMDCATVSADLLRISQSNQPPAGAAFH